MITRRSLLAMLGASTALTLAPRATLAQSTGSGTYTIGSLLEAARASARASFVPPSGELPPPFADLTYNSYRGIRPLPGVASVLPQGENFAVDLLPPGLYFPDPLTVEREVGGAWQEQPFSPAVFDFDERYFDEVPATSPGAGYTGMRVRYPLNAPDVMDEVAVFQGASYFRAIGTAMNYGLSARALAIGTGAPEPEEFPRFSHLRLHEGDGSAIRVEALIDSPSLAGYLDMTIRPGDDTEMDISITVLPRVLIDDIGIAPLTSMFLKGPLHAAVSDDFRPNVHDSDVLFIRNGAGELLWRPIENPTFVQTSMFADTAPGSFGLYQTTRDYEDFEDTEAHYQRRPSATITPLGDWGAGAVTLVEIPTGTEFLDNIVAFWRPAAPLTPGGEYRFDYRITWTLDAPAQTGPAKIMQSRSGREHDQPGARRFVVDFDTPAEGLMMDLSLLGDAPETLYGGALFALPDGRGTRVTFLMKPDEAEALELRLVLRDETGEPVSPVWLHRWTRKRDGGV